MKRESKLNADAKNQIKKDCPGAKVFKHHGNEFSSGIPDTSVTWRGATSWLEFKRLRGPERLHAQLDALQLAELIILQREGGRAWIVAYRLKGAHNDNETLIYSPKFCIGGQEPTCLEWRTDFMGMITDLERAGVVGFRGHNHRAISALLHFTHGR